MGKSIILFDIDGTLTKSRNFISPKMKAVLEQLKSKVTVGLVGGSDLSKIEEQMGPCTSEFEYVFTQNGLVAFKNGSQVHNQSILQFLGEEKLQKFVNFCLRYIADLEIPVKRGTFVEFRQGMLNVSPIGRNCSQSERDEFEEYDREHKIREKFVSTVREKFAHFGLTFAIGGQISFDAFPNGWDKTYCLKLVQDDGFDVIHFFGDKTYKGGNDHEIFEDTRTTGHTVTSPSDTIIQIKELMASL